MNIKEIEKLQATNGVLPASGHRKTDTGFSRDFEHSMQDRSRADYEQYIGELKEKIYKQGEMVAKRADLSEYQKYRELISELISETISNSYAFCKLSQFDARGRHKVYAVIRKVNKRLDDMAAEVLKNESDRIKLLDIADDIRGLIVDMFL
ncbi:MAG: YaaR family protein [Clostridiaceae bacterium]|nr:YaaR family protein [Eubacteriales bacterium]